MQKITTFLWFDGNAEEAINFYCSIFKNSKLVNASRQNGKFFTGTFQLEGQQFMALNGGPHFKFNEAISLFVSVETQRDIDEHWDKLTADGGSPSMCGWLKDKFGLSWQIIPTALGNLIGGPDPVKSGRAVQAMLKMKKIDLKTLQDAYDGKQ